MARPVSRSLRSALAVALGLAFPPAAAAGPPDHSEEAVRSGQQLAAMMAAKKVVSDLPAIELPGLARAWAGQMLREPARHAQAAESRQLLAAEYEQRLRHALRERLRRVHAGFNPGGRDRWFSEAWLLQQIKTGMKGQIEQGIARNAGARFGSLFQTSRQLATQEQLRRLSGVAYPAVEEVEELVRVGWQPAAQDRLAQALVARMSRQTTLLEESARALQQSAAGAIQDARTQHESQAAALTRPVPDGARAAEDIARALRAAVEQVRQQRRAAGRTPHLYPIFPTVQTRLEQRARALEKEKFRIFCQNFPAGVSEARLRAVIEGNPQPHQTLNGSRALVVQALLPEIAARASERYAAGVEAPRRAALQARLRGLALAAPDLRETLRTNLETALALPLQRVRGAIAEAQLLEHFPSLATGRWMPPEEEVRKYDPEQPEAWSYDRCLLLPQVVDDRRSLDSSTLLEETRAQVSRSTAGLLAEGRIAWDAQGTIVSEIKEQIPPAIQSGPAERSVEDWQHVFIQQAEGLWRRQGNDIWRRAEIASPYAASKYRGLFFEREEDIRNYVKSQYEVARTTQKPERPQRAVAGAKASSGGGGRGDGDGGGGGGNSGSSGDGGGGNSGGGCSVRADENENDDGKENTEELAVIAQPGGTSPHGFWLQVLLLLLLAIAMAVLLLRSARRNDLWWGVPVLLILLILITTVAWVQTRNATSAEPAASP